MEKKKFNTFVTLFRLSLFLQGDPTEYVEAVCVNMQNYQAEDYLTGHRLYRHYDSQVGGGNITFWNDTGEYCPGVMVMRPLAIIQSYPVCVNMQNYEQEDHLTGHRFYRHYDS